MRITKLKVFEESVANQLAPNMVSRWKLDDVIETNKTSDAWGGNKGTLYNFDSLAAGAGDGGVSGPMSEANCVSGTCFMFDGVDDYIDCGVDNSLQMNDGSITLSMWFKIFSWPTNYAELFFGGATGGEHGYGIMLGRPLGYIYYEIYGTEGGRQIKNLNVDIPLNQWIHTAVIFNGVNNYLKFYLDGKEKDFEEIDDPKIVNNKNHFIIGKYASSLYYFKGIIDDTRIYNAALSSSQIKQNYIAGLNSLLSKNLISEEEYNQRIENLSQK